MGLGGEESGEEAGRACVSTYQRQGRVVSVGREAEVGKGRHAIHGHK